jgi:hypothetical protein
MSYHLTHVRIELFYIALIKLCNVLLTNTFYHSKLVKCNIRYSKYSVKYFGILYVL